MSPRSGRRSRVSTVRLLLPLLVLTAAHARVPQPYDEDGDAALYRWRTRGHHRRRPGATPAAGAGADAGLVTVHLVPHAHLDVGWLKTVDECWYGANASIQDAAVRDILEAVVGALALNPERTWTLGEQAFFQRWWHAKANNNNASHDSPARALVRRLVADRQLVFVDGGWSQHDTGATHYTTMVDQTAYGQRWIKEQFGVAPRVGWHLDPFGHTATQGALLSAAVGFDAFFFARIDYQDRDARRARGDMEMVWRPSPSLGSNHSILAGALPVGSYCSPPGYDFAQFPVEDDPLLEGLNLQAYVDRFVADMTEYASYVRGSHVMVLMGCDYAFKDAATYYNSLDGLIRAVNRDGRMRARYSDPNTYVDAKHAEQQRNGSTLSFPLKTDDFIPISQDFPATGPKSELRGHMYWTGYFTSRPGLKRMIRESSAYLRAARTLQVLARLDDAATPDPAWPAPGGMDVLASAVGVGAHHDAATGTERQPVAFDYAKRLARGLTAADVFVHAALGKLAADDGDASDAVTDFAPPCRLLNESICGASSSVLGGEPPPPSPSPQQQHQQRAAVLRLVLFNPASHLLVGSRVRLPAGHEWPAPTASVTVTDVATGEAIPGGAVLVPTTPFASPAQAAACGAEGSQASEASTVAVQFRVDLPPLAARTLDVQITRPPADDSLPPDTTSTTILTTLHVPPDTPFPIVLENDLVRAIFDPKTGRLAAVEDLTSGEHASVDQGFFYYPASHSGPWMMRPDVKSPGDAICASGCEASLRVTRDNATGTIVEVHQVFGDSHHDAEDAAWVAQTARLEGGLLELEWTVGPVPVDGDWSSSKEVFSRFASDLGSGDAWTADSNGYEYVRRRRDHRDTYTLNLTEPIAANVVNVNAAVYLRDATRDLVVLNDRSQGATSLRPGELDVFVHRRLLGCDYPGGGGVEPLNETRGFACDPTGGVKPRRWGPGVVVRGTHRLALTKAGRAARVYRDGHERMLRAPVLAIVAGNISSGRGPPPAPRRTKGGAEKAQRETVRGGPLPLPDNVMVLSIERMPGQGASSALVRLQHKYAVGEDPVLSQPARVSLAAVGRLFPAGVLAEGWASAMVEMSLTANQEVATMRRRLRWRVDGEPESEERHIKNDEEKAKEVSRGVLGEGASSAIELGPLQIRAFRIPLRPTPPRPTTS